MYENGEKIVEIIKKEVTIGIFENKKIIFKASSGMLSNFIMMNLIVC